MKKALLIIGGIALAGGIAYYFYNRSQTASAAVNPPLAKPNVAGAGAPSTGRPDMSGAGLSLTPTTPLSQAAKATQGRG